MVLLGRFMMPDSLIENRTHLPGSMGDFVPLSL